MSGFSPELIRGLRGLTRPPATATTAVMGETGELCDLCGRGVAADHRHMLDVKERVIVCACEPCWAMRAGEGDYRPVGSRTLFLEDLELSDDRWASFQIPIGLAFFMRSSSVDGVVALYPSPAGATESELDLEAWEALVADNPLLGELQPDCEGLIVNRLADPPVHVIAPIDRCYALVGLIKAKWEGISGGPGLDAAVEAYFAEMQR